VTIGWCVIVTRRGLRPSADRENPASEEKVVVRARRVPADPRTGLRRRSDGQRSQRRGLRHRRRRYGSGGSL